MNPTPVSAQPTPAHVPIDRLAFSHWLREGLRAGLFLRPRVANRQPTPLQLAGLLLLLSALEVGLGRLEVVGPAMFDPRAWLAPWWGSAALVLLAWWALDPLAPESGPVDRPGLAAWFGLWSAAVLPVNVLSLGLGIAQAHEALPSALTTLPWAGWGLFLVLWVWVTAMTLRLAWQFGVAGLRLALFAVGVATIFALTAWLFPDRPWQPYVDAVAESPPMRLSQQTFENQQTLWANAVDGLAAERPGMVDVYGLVFAPYAPEDVFLRESTLVARLLAERFDAGGRVLHLVNHPATADTYPWATPQNLERAVEALAARMDREHDLLVVYLTSHGASDYRLAASHGPLDVVPLSPGELRAALDKAGIRHRVIAVSACYSGGWIGPLAGAGTLVMTAADATHTSYGCGALSELTFFARAVFDEQLRHTRSFEQAFAAAVPVIRQRENEAGKTDGFSNPQISVGEQVRPVLRALEQRLDGR